MTIKILSALFLLLIVALMLAISFEQPTVNQIPTVNIAKLDCNINEHACLYDSNELKIKIIFDKNIYYLKPFNISAVTENNEIESIHVSFVMKGMNMGINNFKLLKKTSGTKQDWHGSALLPICVTGRADWLAYLEVKTKDKKTILSLPMRVKKYKD